MVLGRSRPRLRADGSRLFAVRNSPIPPPPAYSWPTERGSTLFTAGVDVLGGFPGYADRGCLIAGAQLRITDRYLLVDEGQPHGFGIPIAWLDGTVLVELPGRDDYAVRVFYRTGPTSRLFTLKFRSSRVGGRSGRKSLRAQEALHTAGLDDRYAEHPPLEPDFTLPWEQTREFEHENVIWTGRASAPIRVGAESAPSEVWLTTKSLIWGSGDGEGINRIPLPLLMDLVSTRLRDRIGTPVIYVAIGDDTTGRYELPFAFNLHTPPDRNFRERGAFLVGLRSRGLDDGIAAPYSQPWRTTLLSVDDAEAGAVARLRAPEAPGLTDEPWSIDTDPVDGQLPSLSMLEDDLAETDRSGPETAATPQPRPDNISHFSEVFERRRAAARLTPAPEPRADRPLPPPAFLRAEPVFDLEVTPGPTNGPSNPLLAAYTEIAAQVPRRSRASAEPSPSIESSESAPRTEIDPAGQDLPAAEAMEDLPEEPEAAEEHSDRAPSDPPPLPSNPVRNGGGDLLLAEWTAGTDGVEIDLALSERWAPSSQTLRQNADHGVDPSPPRSANTWDRVDSGDDVTTPPGWWPEFGNGMASSPAQPAGTDVAGSNSHLGASAGIEPRFANDPTPDEPELQRLVGANAQLVDGAARPAVQAYEATAIGALSDVLRVIDARLHGDGSVVVAEHAPSSWEQARAFAELTESVQRGELSAEAAGLRRERLIALGEVCVRLRTLVELHANGIIGADQLDDKRASLLSRLSAALTRGDDER